MFGFKVNIDKWLRREMSATELALLREEDALAESKMRVNAYRERLRRLNERANARVKERITPPKIEIKMSNQQDVPANVVRRKFRDMLP